MTRKLLAVGVVLVVAAWCFAQTYTGEASNRLDINMGITPWKFTKGDPINAQTVGLSDGGWTDVGIPHCVNESEAYTNMISGGGNQYGGTMWYRKHFTLDPAYSARKVFVEFEGANTGAAVYINGTFIPGNSAINPLCTHVNGFIPFVVDITPNVQFGGTDNVLAVKVNNNGGTYVEAISGAFRFGQADGGLVRKVWMHITDKVYVPANVYSVVK
ncbi:MAG TPA: beta galactosidase jelly roll domain-containing protein, partial [Chitinivibrionales bacterium]|nr:beta galactosidase jelly roll domain-containing protein [Chitinivibrionales bacterium]